MQTYTIDKNPNAAYYAWESFGDHTSTQGNMMIINAANDGADCTVNVWKSPMISLPAGDYELSYWVRLSFGGNGDWPTNPPLLKASVNGKDIGTYDAAIDTDDAKAAQVGIWTEVKVPFTLATAGDAQLALCDGRTKFWGDDYALDDIAVTLVEPAQWCSPGYWRNHSLSWPTEVANTTLYNSSSISPPLPPLAGNSNAKGCAALPPQPSLVQVLQNPQCYGSSATNAVASYLSTEAGLLVMDQPVDTCPL